jgi:hypothetical protein
VCSSDLPVVFVSILFGVFLGSIPVINQYLHWNIWFIIPATGLLFGLVIGAIQFGTCFFLSQSIKGASFFVIIVSAIFAYFSVDYGFYLSTKIPIANISEKLDGLYRLKDITTFTNFLKARLGTSTIMFRGSDFPLFSIGGIGTKISYFIDYVGVLFGAFVSIKFFYEKYPYCENCSKFKKRDKKYNLLLNSSGKVFDELLINIMDMITKLSYEDLAVSLGNLQAEYNANGKMKITIDQRVCPICKDASIVGRVYKKDAYSWECVDNLSFVHHRKVA